MMDLILCFPIKSTESLNGKKASEARTAPGGTFALVSAYFTASTLLVCPPEILIIFLLCATTIAFDFDLDYMNDYKLDSNILHPRTNVPSHPPGAGYLSSPFVFLFGQLDKLIDRPIENTRTNPVKSFGYIGFFIAGLFYTYYGSKLLFKIIRKIFIPRLCF